MLTLNEFSFSSTITADTDNVLTPEEKGRCVQLHKSFDNVFNPQFGVYNDRCSRIRRKLNLVQVIPPPREGKLPLYIQSRLELLQKEADKLEALGILAQSECVGVDVQFVSPSFLIKKRDGSFRFATVFCFQCTLPNTQFLPVASHS